MDGSEFTRIILENPTNRALLERLPMTGLNDAWLVSGCLFQTCWNHKAGRGPDFGIKDYDIFYFDDSDLSWEAEDAAIRRANVALGEIGAKTEIRNQARVHLWYEQKFGIPYEPLNRATAGVDNFLAFACMLAIRPNVGGGFEIYAPFGFDDVEAMILRPTSPRNFDTETYYRKANRWRQLWPELQVLDAESMH